MAEFESERRYFFKEENSREYTKFMRQLSRFPEDVFEPPYVSQLEELNLGFNCITEIPKRIATLRATLRKLGLNDNEITALPEELSLLTNLTELSLSDNKISDMPASFSSLVNLEVLDIDRNKLTHWPSAIESMTALQQLSLDGNFHIQSIPNDAFKNLTNLQKLHLGHLSLQECPKSIGCLVELEHLSLEMNYLSDIPFEELSNLTKLIELNLSYNDFDETTQSRFSEFTEKLPQLRRINTIGNKAGSLQRTSFVTNGVNATELRELLGEL